MSTCKVTQLEEMDNKIIKTNGHLIYYNPKPNDKDSAIIPKHNKNSYYSTSCNRLVQSIKDVYLSKANERDNNTENEKKIKENNLNGNSNSRDYSQHVMTHLKPLTKFDYKNCNSDLYQSLGTKMGDFILANLVKSLSLTLDWTRLTEPTELNYINTTNYIRDNKSNILPMDVLTFSNGVLDISIWCIQTYSDNSGSIKPVQSCEVTLNNNIQLGRDYNKSTPLPNGYSKCDKTEPIPDFNEPDTNTTVLSTVKDVFGITYTFVSGKTIGYVIPYINGDLNSGFQPTNASKLSRGISYDKDGNMIIEQSPPIECDLYKRKEIKIDIPKRNEKETYNNFDTYIRGFLIINACDKDNIDNVHFNMIWLSNPTLFQYNKNRQTFEINIGYLIKAVPDNKNIGKYCIRFNKIIEEYKTDYNLPVNSDLLTYLCDGEYNYCNMDFNIMSIEDYWRRNK